ncbi:glycosyltransferase family 87 protein [Mycobacterium sp. 852002-51057_SCH5723018]|uniref:glycosyltransferase family 87 protein n=1 Tax=Mycobacterium sp. 852002-51057_SCH5723018 TaxID=1834094 RepID=UPI0007FB830F|nr:glycosyltransferase family 87 protein [Mycobacterium sp. 852002-51057_SCH5723018]OBG25069.1 hypothetical protein A5764_06565 [Mycobacterium sp. 852002-51057_SCH5723018]
MRQPLDVLRDRISAVRERLSALTGQSERTILLGVVLLASALSAATCFVLTQYYSIDVLSSLVFVPDDCTFDWTTNFGRHCFGDAVLTMDFGRRPNPWEPYPAPPLSSHLPRLNGYIPATIASNYPAAGMLPHMTFWLVGQWLHAPRLGLFAYLLVLAIAVMSPALWAARGARGLERVVVFVACGIAAIPAWMAVDRGNSVGFVVPIALVFLVALCRRRWGLVTVMVVLAAMVKPQFALVGLALFAARQWRWGGVAVAGVVTSNAAAYLLWPRDFPDTIMQSVRHAISYGGVSQAATTLNVSFGKGLLMVPDGIKASANGGTVPDGYLAGPRSLIGYAILVLVVVSVLALGRRIPPVMVGIVLLATAALFPAVALPYYLVFALPVAALVARDPAGPPGTGIFERLAAAGERRRVVGVWVSVAAALSIVHIALPSPSVPAEIAGPLQNGVSAIVQTRALVLTTASVAPLLWLIACGAVIISYARRPAPSSLDDQEPAHEAPSNTAVSASHASEELTGL